MNPHTIKRLFPNASASTLTANAHDYGTPHDDNSDTSGIPNTKQRERAKALEGGNEGKAQGAGRPVVRYLLCRVQLLDVDAKYASVKDTLDGLAKAGLISGDREGEITLQVEQEKVAHYEEEHTEITITYPEIQPRAKI